MKTENDKVSIINFTDYRDFLRMRYEKEKEKNPQITYRYLGRKINSADNYFKYIFDKKRHISIDRVNATAKLFELKESEMLYLMFKIIQVSSKEASVSLTLKQILALIQTDISKDTSYLISRKGWLFSAIYHMSRFADFKVDPGWVRMKISNLLPIMNLEVESAINEVITSGLIIKNVSDQTTSMLDQMGASRFLIETQQIFSDFCRHPEKYKHAKGKATILSINSTDYQLIDEAQKYFIAELNTISKSSTEHDVLFNVYAMAFTLTKSIV